MTHSAKIIADSISPSGVRITSMLLRYPRIIHSEMLRHRVLSRCVASSRAIPVQKFIDQVMADPYIPIHWGKNQKGMQAEVEVNEDDQAIARDIWLQARNDMVARANTLLTIGIHKQITNRLLEPFMWCEELVTGTEWSNFFNLRIHPDAHPEIKRIAEEMKCAMEDSCPRLLIREEWHLPFIDDEEKKNLPVNDLIKISAGRSARLSYMTHEGKRDRSADIALHDRLLKSGHLSPLEHQAFPNVGKGFNANFRGWTSYRKTIPNESDILGTKKPSVAEYLINKAVSFVMDRFG